MKTITMSLKDYEDIIKLKEETEADIEKNMVCREVGGFGPTRIEWINPDSEISKLTIERDNLLEKIKNKKESYNNHIYALERNNEYWKSNSEKTETAVIISKSLAGSRLTELKMVKIMTVREFKSWKKI